MGSLAQFATAFEIKSVQADQRLIVGYAAVAGNLDRVGDIIDPAALQKVVATQQPTSVSAFIGHDTAKIPVGVCIDWQFDGKGLLTTTRIFEGPDGDSLLGAARGMQAVGRSLGQSIGYFTHERRFERGPGGKTVRRLLDIAIGEYSFADSTQIANTQALVQAVKQASGDAMPDCGYVVEQQGNQWAVIATDDGDLVGLYASQEIADAVLQALATEMADDDSEDAPTKALPNRDAPYKVQLHGNEHVVTRASDGKEMSRHPSRAQAMAAVKELMAQDAEKTIGQKAAWSTAEVNNLPDSAFLFIADGGSKDDGGRTVPRSLRHFPYKGPDGAVDLPHLRNALARIPQAGDIPGLNKDTLQARAERLLADATGGKTMPIDVTALPDRAFLYVAPGTIVEDGRTRPLANRRYPYTDAEGKLAPELLTAAQADLSPERVTDLPPLVQIELYARARRLADQAAEGKTMAAEAPEWQQGASLRVLGVGYQLQDMAEAIATAQAAMRHLGEDTKAGARMQAPMRQKLRECMAALKEISDWADMVDAGQADAAKVARNRREIEMLELTAVA